MNLKNKIFGNFDFSCLSDYEFKEDAVREDIIAPLLRSIGYSATGKNKMIRSRSLTHPYVMFGSQKRKVNIIPDYLLQVDGKPCFVLDAKGPREEITKGDNVAQVYSYAIHPEVRAWNYGLCNGKKLALFEITSIEPKCVYDLTELNESDIHEINQKLNPRSIGNNEVLNYFIDGGTYLHFVMDLPIDTEIILPSVPLPLIGIVSEGQYTTSAVCKNMADRELAFSFDFNQKLLDLLLSELPEKTSTDIRSALTSYPYVYKNNLNPPVVDITSVQATEPTYSGAGEMFFPLTVVEFKI